MGFCAGVIALCVFAATSPGVADEADVAPKKEKAPRFTLMDSHNEPFAFMFPVEKPVLLTFADQGGHEQMDAWTEPLLEKYGDRIDHRAVAWLEAIPRLMTRSGGEVSRQDCALGVVEWRRAVGEH